MTTKTIKNIMSDIRNIADYIGNAVADDKNGNFETEDVNDVIDDIGLIYTRAGFIFWNDPNAAIDVGQGYDDLKPMQQLYEINDWVSPVIVNMGVVDANDPTEPAEPSILAKQIFARTFNPAAPADKLVPKAHYLLHSISSTAAWLKSQDSEANTSLEKINVRNVDCESVGNVVWDHIRNLMDPDVVATFEELGLIDREEIKVDPNTKTIQIVYKPTTVHCIFSDILANAIKIMALKALFEAPENMSGIFKVSVVSEHNTHLFSEGQNRTRQSLENLKEACRTQAELSGENESQIENKYKHLLRKSIRIMCLSRVSFAEKGPEMDLSCTLGGAHL